MDAKSRAGAVHSASALSVLGGTVATHAMDYMDGSAVRGHGGDLRVCTRS